MNIPLLALALAATLSPAIAAPQLGELADYAPALPGDVPAILASSTRKSPGPLPPPIAPQERFATGTTPGATGDGLVGVILEPDLVVGKPVTPGAKVVKIRSGPYTIPAGKFFDPLPQLIKKPCSNCYITAAQGVLEFEDGRDANFQDGAWQHHMVVSELDGEDAVCGPEIEKQIAKTSKTATGGSTKPLNTGRRIFGSGVERVPVRINRHAKYGLYFKNNWPLLMSIELMSQAAKPLKVYSAITYEYVEGPAAAGYKDATVVYMDITGCGISSAPAKNHTYRYTSPPWTSPVDARFLFALGHLHNGGTAVQLFKNSQQICLSKALYGHRRPGYGPVPANIIMPGMSAADNAPDSHISDMASCEDFGALKKGDTVTLTANYDADRYPQMVDKKGMQPIMGISLVYIGT
jgi:hypothetical protein